MSTIRKTRSDKGKPRKPKDGPDSFKLVDNCYRGPLGEGRSYGVGFAFCKREGTTFTTVGPLSPCKDYLNDQLYSERTGNDYRRYGYRATKQSIFTDGFGYVAFSIMTEKCGAIYATMQKEKDYLAESHGKVAAFVNAFESALKIPLLSHTAITKVGENLYVAAIPDFWCLYTYLISFWTLLVRIAIESYYAEGDPVQALRDCSTGDSMLARCAIKKFDTMVTGVIPKQDFTMEQDWHNQGVSGFDFPS